MTADAGLITDRHGNRYASVHIEELDEWAWLLGRLGDWMTHASPDTTNDWNTFFGPCGPHLNDVTYVLGHWTVRRHTLANRRP